LPVFFLFTNHWFLVFLNIPLDIWFAYKFVLILLWWF